MLFRARSGTFLTFALAGLLTGVWVARMPALAGKFGLNEGEIGIVVLVWGLGATVAMQVLRGVMARAGSRNVLRVALPLTALSYAGVALAPGYGLLLGAVALFGMTFGVTDIAMNAQGSVVEQAYRRSIMSGMHAGWCVGAMSGGLFGVATAAAGLGFTTTVLVASLAALPLGLLLGRTYLPDAYLVEGDVLTGAAGDSAVGTAAGAAAGTGRAARRLPGAVYLIGVLAFIAFMTEGSIADWSGLLLHDELHATQAVAALGYPMFELAMLFGRLVGDRVRMRIGTRRLLTGAGIGTALGMTAVVLAPSAPVAIAGFFVTGLVVCTVVPTTISLAGTAAPGRPAAAVAQVGAMGYGGLLLGPVVVGFLSDATSLRVGVGVVVVLALLIAAGARLIPLQGASDISARSAEARSAEVRVAAAEALSGPAGPSHDDPNDTRPQPVAA